MGGREEGRKVTWLLRRVYRCRKDGGRPRTCARVGHDGAHVCEVHVDEARLDDDLRDAHHA